MFADGAVLRGSLKAQLKVHVKNNDPDEPVDPSAAVNLLVVLSSAKAPVETKLVASLAPATAC